MYVQSNNFNIIYSLFFYTYMYVLTLSSVSLCQEVQRRSLKMGYEKCYHHEKKYAPLLLPLSSLSVLVHVFIDIFLNWFISLNVKYFINYNLFSFYGFSFDLSFIVFWEASVFNRDLSKWNTSSVTGMLGSTFLSFFSLSDLVIFTNIF